MDINLVKVERIFFESLSTIANKLNVSTYVIGGFVRDKILGRNSKDIDVLCIGDAIALAEAVAESYTPKLKVSFFKTYGTAQLKLPSGLEIEFVGARKESYAPESRNPKIEIGTLEDDLHRRDFTINTLAININQNDYGTMLDTFNGLNDIENRVIRTPLDPDITFSDDPLRMIRAIRFASQLDFQILPDTFAAIKRNSSRISIVSKERITEELNKIVLSKKPSIGFDLLFKSGLLEVFFPQMVLLYGVETEDGKGHKDNFYHTLQVLDNVAYRTNSLWLRWAAILHDIAKPATKRFDKKLGWTFHGHDALGQKMCKRIFTQLKLPLNEHLKYVEKLVGLHLRPISLSKENITDSAMRRLLFDAGDALDDLMILCESDITSKNKFKVRRYLENFERVKERLKVVEERDKILNWQPPIDGSEIMKIFNLLPSKEVGIIKTALREAILDGVIQNDYKSSYQFIISKGVEMGLTPQVSNLN